MASIVEQENEKFRIELEEVRATIELLQQSSIESRSFTGNTNATSGSAFSASSWSGSDNSAVPDGVGDGDQIGNGDQANEFPTSIVNTHRSVILSGVRENPGENLLLLVLDLFNEIEIHLRPPAIESVYRIGERDPKSKRPRSVKCVF